MTTSTHSPLRSCHVCGISAVSVIPDYKSFHRVTSDCRPWPPGGGLGLCKNCGCAQAILDEAWHSDTKRIYSGYAPYHQSEGVEQNIFDQASGAASARSQRLVQLLHTNAPLPATGSLLDIGCGNGALLRAFGAAFKNWRMAGTDVHEHLRPVIEGIPNVEKLYTCPINEVPGKFSLLSLIHVLEHIDTPRDFLVQLREKLEDGGLLLVQVPDCEQNPFTLLVADHASHFFLDVLQRLVASAGFTVIIAANNWVTKELTIVARKSSTIPTAMAASASDNSSLLQRNLKWLKQLAQSARELSASKPFGLFGTSIAATWVYSELDGRVDFFVDEDPNRPGRTCFGKPIYSPDNIPSGARVFIALQPIIATGIGKRMQGLKLNAQFYTPSEFN